MSRRIAVELYDRLVALRPDWHDDDPARGVVKVVMTGSAADPPRYQPHLHSGEVRKKLKARAKDPDDPLEIVIVRDMWLTGFDAPALHTMYVDKPMQGAGLMQAIARVNRTFRDKPGGLIVDYLGIATHLRQALAEYSPADRDQAGVPIEQMVAAMLEKHDIVQAHLLRGPLTDGLVFDAIRARLIEIGEAVKDLDADLLAQQPQIPWRDIAAIATSSPIATSTARTRSFTTR
ncbi:MAG: type I restriction enzyme subunit R domain-containing protein [Mycobacteriales bacterium]